MNPSEIPLRPSRMQQAITVVAVLVPFLGLVAAISFWWGRGFTWTELFIFLGMYITTGLGITVGYHRLFTHRSFETVRPVKFILAVLGSMAVEGPVLKWAAVHRRHHQHSDQADDPHSPNRAGSGLRGVLAGLWHAHMGWMFIADPPNLSRYVPDLHADKLLRFVSHLFPAWVFLGLLIPTVIGAALTQTWTGALLGFIWGGLVRTFFVHHITWSINSVCHLWGERPFKSHDHSRNNFLFGWIGMGEGWHNNHHAFPVSARHGLRWWEFDLSYLVIHALRLLGLAWRVQVPSRDAMAAKRLQSA